MSELEFLYRYEEVRWSLGVDEFDNPFPRYNLEIILRKYPVFKKTPKGAWIRYEFDQEPFKFVNLIARKRFACRTIEEAKESFVAHKKRQIQLLRNRLSEAEEGLKIVGTNKKTLIQ